jgi:hypothetical protein
VASRCKQTTPSLWPKPKPDDFPRPVSVSSCYRVPQRTTALWGRAGWEIVGRDHLGRGSVQNEAHKSKTASMSGDDGRAIEGPGRPITYHAAQRTSPHVSPWRAREPSSPSGRCNALNGASSFQDGTPGTAGTGKRDRRSAASAARSARRISPPGNGASQAGPARQASHTTTPGVAVSWEWTPVRGKGGERTMAATIMPMRRPCKSVRDCAPTASVPDARPSEITRRPPTALRRANTRRPLIARRSLIALPGRTSPGRERVGARPDCHPGGGIAPRVQPLLGRR